MDVLGINFSEVTMESSLAKAREWLDGNGLHMVFTPNPEIVWAAKSNLELKNALDEADMCLPDGIGIVIASRILGRPMAERVAGYDFFVNLSELGAKTFLFGSKEGVAARAAEKLANVVGTRNGYFNEDEADDIIREINESGAEVLAVCLGAPKQEVWIHKNRDKFTNVKIAIGVGGALDVLAGNVRRAPKVWQKFGLEWLYRAIKQPERFARLTVLPKFIWAVIKQGRR